MPVMNDRFNNGAGEILVMRSEFYRSLQFEDPAGESSNFLMEDLCSVIGL
jgi:hypothetical protein